MDRSAVPECKGDHKPMAKQAGFRAIRVAAIVAIIFGALTIISGGAALFGGSTTEALVGDAVPFVLWFNFGAGFAYIATGVGLFLKQPWAAHFSTAIVLATVFVFALLGVTIWSDAPFEMRTVLAMIFRILVWIGIAFVAHRTLSVGNRDPRIALD